MKKFLLVLLLTRFSTEMLPIPGMGGGDEEDDVMEDSKTTKMVDSADMGDFIS